MARKGKPSRALDDSSPGIAFRGTPRGLDIAVMTGEGVTVVVRVPCEGIAGLYEYLNDAIDDHERSHSALMN